MKLINRFIFTLFLVFAKPALGQSIKIKLELASLPDGIQFRLSYKEHIIDSASSKDGFVLFKIHKKEARPAEYLVTGGINKDGYQIYVDHTSARFIGEYTNVHQILSSVGSQSQNEFKEYINTVALLSDQLSSTPDSLKKTAANQELFSKLKSKIAAFIKVHPNSIFGTQMLFQELQRRHISGDEATVLLNNIGKLQRNTPDGKTVSRAISLIGNPEVGSMAPEIALKTMKGRIVHLSDYRGRLVVLIFSDFNCPAGKWETPLLIKLYNDNMKNNLVFIGINMNNSKDEYIQGLKKYQIPWLCVSDQMGWESEPVLRYGVNAIPTHVIIDESGKIIGEPIPVWDLETELKKHFQAQKTQ